jgi:hypothetical protein
MRPDDAFWWLVAVVLATIWCMSLLTLFAAPRAPVKVECDIHNPAPVWYGTFE